LQIELMKDRHIQKILSIDETSFQRDKPRSLENLRALRRTDPEGCFVLRDGRKLLGYSYSKTFGSEGYLGPVGIQPSHQKTGYGKALIKKNLHYLSKRCRVIGLEVRPEAGDNLGLYHKMGFIPGYPSMIFHFPEKLNMQRSKFPVKISSSTSFKVIDGLESWTRSVFQGVSYSRDLELTLEFGGQLVVAKDEKGPIGFLAYSETLQPYVWGMMNPQPRDEIIMADLLSHFREKHGGGELRLLVNSRYQRMVDLLLKQGFMVYKSVNRMFLSGYEGKNLHKSRDLVMRAWHA
jgi:GNAT superfamily N-acetyltransferase